MPNIFQNLKALLTPILANRRVTFSSTHYTGGGTGGRVGFMGDLTNRGIASSGFDLDATCGDVLDNSIVAACVNAIAQALPEAPILLEKRVGGNEFERVDSHPVLDLLHNPNPYLSEAELWGITTAFERTRGEAFWYFEYEEGGSVPKEIWFRAPQYVQVLSDEQRFISGYLITSESGQQVELEDCDVVHFRHQLSPYNPRAGWTPLQTGRRQIAGDNSASLYHAAILRNAGAASLIISLKDAAAAGEVTPGQLDEYVQQFKRKTSGAGAGAILGMDLPLDVHKVGYSPDEMSLEKLLEYYESRVCALTGVNRRVINLGQDPTYENSRVALKDFWERTIIPMRRRHAAMLSSQILPLFGLDPSQYRLRFDFSEVEALRENVDALHTRWRETLEAGGVDLFTFQEKIGLAPDEKLKGRFVKVSAAMEEASEKGDEVKNKEGYDPNQPRDENGQWTSGGASARAASHAVEASLDKARVALEVEGNNQLTSTGVDKAKEARERIIAIDKEGKKKLAALKDEDSRLKVKIKETTFYQGHDRQLREEQYQKYLPMAQRRYDLAVMIDEQQQQNVRDILSVLAVDNPSSIHSNMVGAMPLDKLKNIETGVSLVSQLVDEKVLGSSQINFYHINNKRSKHEAGKGISMGSRHNADVVVHEVGHYIEYHNSDVSLACQEYLELRKKKAELQHKKVELKQLPLTDYKEGEKAYTNVFPLDDYTAKVYESGATEILSMGLQYMVTDPVKLAHEDPGLFEFTFNIVRGKIPHRLDKTFRLEDKGE